MNIMWVREARVFARLTVEKKHEPHQSASQNHEKNIPRQKQSVGNAFTARDKMESATMAAIQRLSQFSGRLPKGRARWRARWKLDVDYGEQPPFPHHSCTLNSISCWILSHSTRLILLSINLSLTLPVFILKKSSLSFERANDILLEKEKDPLSS